MLYALLITLCVLAAVGNLLAIAGVAVIWITLARQIRVFMSLLAWLEDTYKHFPVAMNLDRSYQKLLAIGARVRRMRDLVGGEAAPEADRLFEEIADLSREVVGDGEITMM